MAKESLYLQVVEITSDLLGPASDRFVSRQIRNHLKKEPEKLNAADLDKLCDWLQLAMAFITSDKDMVRSYINHLKSLAKPPKRTKTA